MLRGKDFCVTVTSAVALVAFIFAMRFAPDFVDWQGWKLCELSDCNIQSWLGALSGWFGGLAAVVTIMFVIRQIGEQKRQTDFIVGDALPTVDAVEHLSDSSELVVRIVNWNRRGIIVHEVTVPDSSLLVFPNRLEIAGKKNPIDIVDFGIRPFALRGWEDRSGKPCSAEIKLVAYKSDDKSLRFQKSWAEVTNVVVRIQILGDAHTFVDLAADTRPILSRGHIRGKP